jgi:RND superfamily putative drug exporter
VLGCSYLGGQLGNRKLTPAETGNGSSGRAAASLRSAGLQEHATESVLLSGRSSARVHAAEADLIRRLRSDADVAALAPPRTRQDGREALVQAAVRGDPEKAYEHVGAIEGAVRAVALTHPGVTLHESGRGSGQKAVETALSNSLHGAELAAIPITLLILGLVFGAAIAALVPVLVGLTSVFAALGLERVISHLVPSFSTTNSAILLVGLAVGVDYCLFYLRREREERRVGRSPAGALSTAAGSVGHAVMISGGIVLLAVGGLLLAGDAGFVSIGVGTMLVVAVAVLGSLTVLPALLALLGDRVERGRLPRLWTQRSARSGSRAWRALSGAAVARPWRSLALVALALGAVGASIAQIHLSNNGVDDLPSSNATVRSFRAVERAFPGAPETATVVVHGAGAATPAGQRRLLALGRQAAREIGVAATPRLRTAAGTDTAALSLAVPGDGEDSRTSTALSKLENTTVPAVRDAFPRATVELGGEAAEARDFATLMSQRAPIVIGVVLLLGFVLLLLAFRSLAVAAVVLALNCLSVAAAGGALVLIFQHHWAEGPLGFTANGAVTDWLPLFGFVLLFGLSMDYTVLIVSRVRELVRAGLPGRVAAAEGVAATSATVTGAALVMIAVFSVFGALEVLELKELGVGLAVAVLIDATIIRAVALPAALGLVAGPRRGRRRARLSASARPQAPRERCPARGGGGRRKNTGPASPGEAAVPARRPAGA